MSPNSKWVVSAMQKSSNISSGIPCHSPLESYFIPLLSLKASISSLLCLPLFWWPCFLFHEKNRCNQKRTSTHPDHDIYLCVYHLPSSSYQNKRSMLLSQAFPPLPQCIPFSCMYSRLLVQQLITIPSRVSSTFPSESFLLVVKYTLIS